MPSLPRCENAKSWRELYVAALFEADSAEITRRIADAERALVIRARELFHESGDNIEEAEALDNAMYSLNALRNVYRCGQDSVQRSHGQAA
ncbi:MAG: hypothetical protein WB566_17455 [Terriglobales bacterium]